MKVDVLTLFPAMFAGPMNESILRRAQESGRLELAIHNLRDWTNDRHRKVDDEPYGGGPGMVLKPEPIFEAIEELKRESTQVVMMTPQGEPFKQAKARALAGHEHLILLCGSYEGFDERVRTWVDHELSIGDYVLTNGGLPAMVLIDAVTRLLPGVLGDDESSAEESFSGNTLEYPQYTRPADFRGMKVPEVLLGGNHGAVEAWRSKQAESRTRKRRPDLNRENKNDLNDEKQT
ncbi:MAG: tRNA (guanosine(37)-N1)-methyltransferase TrmD [Verrucomicrobiota bacterium]|nr:tRNA (guanosine(37)-N1)-methyltransferase TrmD [Verrucomicrobiota bacterium]